MCYTNKKYSFTLCLLISIVVTCSLSHGKQSPIHLRPSRVIRDTTHSSSNSTDGNESDVGKEITSRTSDSDIPDVTLTPSRVFIKPTVTVTATRIGMSRYFSTSLPSPTNDGNVEELSPSGVPTTPTRPPHISQEEELEANAENLLPTASENASIITPQAVTTTPEPTLIMQKYNSSEEAEEKKGEGKAIGSPEEKVQGNTEEKAHVKAQEKTQEKDNTEENNSEWDILDPVSYTDNELLEQLPDPVPLVSPTEMADLEDSQLEEDLAEVFNNERKPPRRRKFRTNNLPGRRMRKVKVPRNNSIPFPTTDDSDTRTIKKARPNSFNQVDLKALPKRTGNPRMTRRFRSTTTTTTNPTKLLPSQASQAPSYVTELAITEVPPPAFGTSFGSKKGRITPVLLTSPIISSFKDRIQKKIQDGFTTPEPQIERPTAVTFTEKNSYFSEKTDGGSDTGEDSKKTEASKKSGNVHNNETGEWLHSENSKHHDIPVSDGQYDEREDWEKNYMKLQQNSFFNPSAEEEEEEPTAIITIDDIPNQPGNVSSSRQGLINNSPELDAPAVIIEHHHHHEVPDSMAGFFPDKSPNTLVQGENPSSNKYEPEGPSIYQETYQEQSFAPPQQNSNGPEYYPSDMPYPSSPSSPSYNPYMTSAEAPPMPEFLTDQKPQHGSHFDRTKINLVSHSVSSVPSSELGFMDKPIFMDNPMSDLKTDDGGFTGMVSNGFFRNSPSETIPPISNPLRSPMPPPRGYPRQERPPPKAPKHFIPSAPDRTFPSQNIQLASNRVPQPGESSEYRPVDQTKQGSMSRGRSPYEEHFKSMTNSIIFKPPPQSNFPIFESAMPPSFSPMPSSGPEKFPSNFKDENNVIEIHHHHFPDGSSSVYSEPSGDGKYFPSRPPLPFNKQQENKNSKEVSWNPISSPPSSGPSNSQLSPEPFQKHQPSPENSPSRDRGFNFLRTKKRNLGGTQDQNPIASSDFSGSHGSVSNFPGYGVPLSPPLTLPMPGLVNIPTPPPESYAMNEVTPNQHFPPHTHSMATYSDYEPANPPLPSGHALSQHFDHFVQNAGEFKGQSEEQGKNSEERFKENPPPRHLSQNTRQKQNFRNPPRGKPESGHYNGYTYSNPSTGNYFEKDNANQGNIEQNDPPNFDDNPSPYPYQDDKARPYDILRVKPDNQEYKQQFQENQQNSVENLNGYKNNNNADTFNNYEGNNVENFNNYGNHVENGNKFQDSNDFQSGNKYKNSDGYPHSQGEDIKIPQHNELLNNFKDIAETGVRVKENEKGKAEDGNNPYSETPYIIMFPNMYPKKGNPPPHPRPSIPTPIIHTTEASTLVGEHFSANPEKLLGPGMKVVPVHPRHQIMKALASKQYLKKLEALQLKEKRPPNTIFTPYGVLVPMGISSPTTLASQASAPPKLTTLLTAHSHIFPSRQGKAEGNQKSLPTDEKALLSLLLGAHFQQQGKNGKQTNGAPTSAMDSALDLLAEKLAARLSPVEDPVIPNSKKQGKSHGHQQSYGNQGSYSELQPVKTSVGEEGSQMPANGTIKRNSHNNGKALFASVSAALQAAASEKEKEKPTMEAKDGTEYKVPDLPNPTTSSSKYLKALLKERLVELLEERYKEVQTGTGVPDTTTGKGLAPSPEELTTLKRKENSATDHSSQAQPSLRSPLKAIQALVSNPFALGSNPVPTHVKPNSQQSQQQKQNTRHHYPQPGGILNAIKRLFSFGRQKEHHGKMNMRKHGNGTGMNPDRMKNRQDFPPRNLFKHPLMPRKGKLSKFDFKHNKNERPIFPSMYGFKSTADMERMLKYLLKSKAEEDEKMNEMEKASRKMSMMEGKQEGQKHTQNLGFFKSLDKSNWVPRQQFLLDGLSTSASKPNPMAIKVISAPQITTSKFQAVKAAGAETTKLKGTPAPLAYPANLLPGSTNSWKPMPESLSFMNSLMPQGSTTSAPSYLTNLYAALNPNSKITISDEYSGHRIQPRSLNSASSRA